VSQIFEDSDMRSSQDDDIFVLSPSSYLLEPDLTISCVESGTSDKTSTFLESEFPSDFLSFFLYNAVKLDDSMSLHLVALPLHCF
jgi:hypothetical protein